MEYEPCSLKVCDDLLFVKIKIPRDYKHFCATYHCLHIPTLVISTQLPAGTFALTKWAFYELLPKCQMEVYTAGPNDSFHEEIYPIPSCLPTYPRYCFILSRGLFPGIDWEILEVEIDLSIPGPIKIFSSISQQYTVPHQSYICHASDDDLLLSLPSKVGFIPNAPLHVRFLRVGKPEEWREARLGGVNPMRLARLHVNKDVGYIIAWVKEGRLWWTRERAFIWWVDGKKQGHTVRSLVQGGTSGWSRRLLRPF